MDAKLKRQLNNTMTVQELINFLQDYNPEMRVMIGYNYGDHWNTQVADTISEPEELPVEYSDYHNRCKIKESDDDGDGDIRDNENDGLTVLILK